MALIHQGIWSTLQAIDTADISNGDTAIIYYNSRPRTFTFNSASTEAENNTRPGPYYLRPHDYSTAGVWEETIGNDLDVFNAGQIIGSVLQSTNWGASAGSQFNLDDGKLEIRQSGGGITIKAGGDLVLIGDDSDPGIIKFEGSSYNIQLGMNTTGSSFSILPLTDDVVTFHVGAGYASDSFDKIQLISKTWTYIKADAASNGSAEVKTSAAANLGRVGLAITDTSGTYDVRFDTNSGSPYFGPNSNDDIDCGRASYVWRTGYFGDLTLKEKTTPTAVTNHGKLYTKSDNKLYFQDGGGTEHEVAYA